MSGSEWFFMLMPLAWPAFALLVVKDEPVQRFAVRWALMAAACILLGFVMLQRISAMMGARVDWAEGFSYGWFLAGLFSVLQVFKKVLRLVLEKTVSVPTVFLRKAAVAVLYYAVLFVVMVPFFLAMTSVHRCKAANAADPLAAAGLAYEDAAWKTADGLMIRGWFIPAASDRAVLIAHGLGANKANFLGTAVFWHDLGFNVLIFDLRGHGNSDGRTVSFGYHERLDVIGGLEYLVRLKKFSPSRIVGYGVSFGGAAMMHAAAEVRGFNKLVIDSSFASLDAMAAHIVEGEPVVPPVFRQAFKELGLFFIRLDVGFDIRERSPENVVGRFAGIPVLFIHGRGDPLILWTQSQRLYERAGEPKRLRVLDTRGHFTTMDDPQYREIVMSFLRNGQP